MDGQKYVTEDEIPKHDKVDVITDTFDITPEEDEQLTLEKRMADADDEKNSLNEEYYG